MHLAPPAPGYMGERAIPIKNGMHISYMCIVFGQNSKSTQITICIHKIFPIVHFLHFIDELRRLPMNRHIDVAIPIAGIKQYIEINLLFIISNDATLLYREDDMAKRIFVAKLFYICSIIFIFLIIPHITYAVNDTVTAKFSLYYPSSYPQFKYGIEPWQKMVEKESNGKYKFQNYMNGIINNARHGFRAATSGACDVTHGYPTYNAAAFDLSFVDYLPFLFPNNYTTTLVMEELYPKYFKAEYERQGGYLAFWINCSNYVFLTKKPVRSLDDLKGMKIRSAGGLHTAVTAALGAVPVSVLPAETYTSVQSGVVDGAILPAGTLTSYKVHEVAKYCTVMKGFSYAGVPFVMRRGFFDALQPDQKDYLYRKLRQCANITSYGYVVDEKESLDLMKASGVEIIEFSPEELKRVRKAVQPVYDKYIADCKAKGLPIEELLKDISLLVDKYGKMTSEEIYAHVTKNPAKGLIDY